MSARLNKQGIGTTAIVGWIVLLAGFAILIYELIRGEGISLVGIGIAVVGAAVVFFPREETRDEAQ